MPLHTGKQALKRKDNPTVRPSEPFEVVQEWKKNPLGALFYSIIFDDTVHFTPRPIIPCGTQNFTINSPACGLNL